MTTRLSQHLTELPGLAARTAPTPRDRADRAPQMVDWITLADRLQLERDLDDLPELVEVMDRHYDDLLGRGSRNPDDPSHRYPIEPTVLDLADRRTKDLDVDDPIGEADLARRIGARRVGVLPTLVAWVGLTAGEMHDLDVDHRAPSDPAAGEPTVSGECLWLTQHLDWIVGQQWVIEFAGEIRTIAAELVDLVGDGTCHDACRTADDLAEAGIASRAAIYRWWKAGQLTDVGKLRGRRVFVVHEVRSMACKRTTFV